MFRRLLALSFFFPFFLKVHAQKESANWFFGQSLGLSFVNTNSPRNITGFPPYTNLSPSTVVSDAGGNLQFIFANNQVFNRNYTPMPGSSLFKLGASWNLLLAAQAPSSPTRYYLFYMTDGSLGLFQLRYAVIDMSLNGGLGDVISADNPIDSGLSPAFTLVNRSGSDEFWIVGHKMGTTTFSCSLVTAAGISGTPVTSQAGTNPNVYQYNFQDMKTSPNGKMIAGIGYYLDQSGWFWLDDTFLEVFNFDSQTGIVTNKVRTITASYIYQDSHYLCFSPDNRLVYADFATLEGNLQPCGLASTNLYQYNLCYNNPDSFTLYAPLISQTLSTCSELYWGKMQLGIDKKIYMPYTGTATLSAIDFPNRIGTSSMTNFNEYTLPARSDYGIPDFYHYYLDKAVRNNILYTGGCYPNPTHFTISNAAIPNVHWNFGDPASGAANISNSPAADHLFSAPGQYTVTAGLYSSTNTSIETVTELVEIKDPAKRLLDGYPKEITFCNDQDFLLLKLHVVNGIFSWHVRYDYGYFSAGISDSLYVGKQGTSTIYVQMRQNDCAGCLMEDSIRLTVYPTPSAAFGPNGRVCTGDSLQLYISAPGASLAWSTGAVDTSMIYVKQPGTYTGTASYPNNTCPQFVSTISVIAAPGVDFKLPNDTTLCNQATLFLDPAVPQASYVWQDYTSSPTFNVTQPGQYWVRITNNNNCSKTDTVNVAYVNAAAVYLGADTTLCQGDSLLLQPGATSGTFQWSTGGTDPSILVRSSGTYWLKVDNGVCTVADTLQAVFNPRPAIGLGNDTSVCDRQTLVLRATDGQAAFLWQNGSLSDTLQVSGPGDYWLQETAKGCTIRDTIKIGYNSLPVIDLGKDTTICAGQQLTLSAFTPSISSYLWQDQSPNKTYSVTSQGNYWVKVTGNNGCMNADTINVGIIPLPDFTLGKDTVLCAQQQLSYNFDLPGAGYTWSTGGQTGQLIIRTAGNYWLTVTAQGCSSKENITVGYKPLPVIDLGKDTSLCEGQTVLLTPGPPGYTYTWQDNSAGATYLVKEAGLYAVAASLDGCMQKDSILIDYLYKPLFSLVHDTLLCRGLMILLDPGIRDASFRWQDGSTTPTFNVTDAGFYKLTASNQCGDYSDSVNVVEGPCKVWLPNAFTPNNDGHNDIFRLKYPELVKTFRLVIYNRAGQAVFESSDPYKGWDGRYKGMDAPTANYVWVLSYTDLYGYNGNVKGSVLLVR